MPFRHGKLAVSKNQRWQKKALAGLKSQFRSRPKDEEGKESNRLTQKAGELELDYDILKEAVKPYLSSEGRTSGE